MGMVAEGIKDKEIEKRLGIPYTTVIAYRKWDADKVKKKKEEWEAKKSAPEPMAVVESPVPVEEDVVPADTNDAEDGKVVVVECEEDPTMSNETERWFIWDKENRENADKFTTTEDYPLYAPCLPDQQVLVRFSDSLYSPETPAKKLSWGTKDVQYYITHFKVV